ncbi:hypothetical protein ASPZODRAFT_68480 [Penicilliopsis zonata CBS 506.65]|uniref:Cytochrome b5 heme-binding domain-containing protein n=1 Tax=Penicilliopsis zonata CBS 506.65 TaxID=1073090 RepID=A0A1L9SET1_9EURO|nr:hypothetical protein ASPZODRAFT_68480 [Penicilliopsis zonata CBS 506.65]OJJ45658.1 hypothetical protein ASPZODRAFT_68480 [Penicilliopsis zonata CBS 506.65]
MEFTLEDVATHNSRESLYVIIHGKVYDVTGYADEHPGGADILMEVAGADGTDGFDDIGHSEGAKTTLEGLLVGRIKGNEAEEEVPLSLFDIYVHDDFC